MEQKKSKLGMGIVVAIVLLLGVGAAVYALTMQPEKSTTESTGSSTSSDSSSDTTEDPDTSVSNTEGDITQITFRDDGFVKPVMTVKAGSTVRVANQSSMDLEFSSADHPTHLEEPALNMDVLAAGESGTFTAPTEPGEYGFHDHLNDQFTGTLVVE